MRFEALKVGELARRTGLTIRALHHYDEIGLLRPSQHSEAGYRLYTAGDVARLQQVLSLRQLGFSLEEVRDCLDRPGFSPLESIRLHIGRLREQVEMQRELCEKLEAIAAHFRAAEEVSADEFLRVIARMTMIESYYTERKSYLRSVRYCTFRNFVTRDIAVFPGISRVWRVPVCPRAHPGRALMRGDPRISRHFRRSAVMKFRKVQN